MLSERSFFFGDLKECSAKLTQKLKQGKYERRFWTKSWVHTQPLLQLASLYLFLTWFETIRLRDVGNSPETSGSARDDAIQPTQNAVSPVRLLVIQADDYDWPVSWWILAECPMESIAYDDVVDDERWC